MTPEEIVRRYAGKGYDFLCISDHMKLNTHRLSGKSGFLLLHGFEWNSKVGEHMNLVSFRKPLLARSTKCHDQKQVLAWMAGEPVLVILNHPNWQEPPHYSREDLMDRPSAAGIEIYNGLIDFLSGTSLATEKWDYLLSRGRKVLGFASDDAHSPPHVGNAWIMVRAAARTPGAVFKAVRSGNFYCSTGVTFDVIRRQGQVITVAARNAREIWAVGEWGVRLDRVRCGRIVFDFATMSSAYRKYVRFVAFGKGAAQAWTQPFFMGEPIDDKRFSPFVGKWRLSRLVTTPLSQIKAAKLSDPSLDWTDVRTDAVPEGFVNVSRRHGSNDGVCYVGTSVTVPRDGVWTVCLGHDGGVRLFVDGRQVLETPKRVNPAVPDRSKVNVRLSRGGHEIVAALKTDSGMGQGIMLRFMIPVSVRKLPRVPVFPESLPLCRVSSRR